MKVLEIQALSLVTGGGIVGITENSAAGDCVPHEETHVTVLAPHGSPRVLDGPEWISVAVLLLVVGNSNHAVVEFLLVRAMEHTATVELEVEVHSDSHRNWLSEDSILHCVNGRVDMVDLVHVGLSRAGALASARSCSVGIVLIEALAVL